MIYGVEKIFDGRIIEKQNFIKKQMITFQKEILSSENEFMENVL